MVRHWSHEGPPTYVAAAAYLGLRKAKAPASELIDGQDLLNFLGAFPIASS
jgi:hypothetical protein